MQGIQIIKALMITSTPIPEAPNHITIQNDMKVGVAITGTLVIMLMRAITGVLMGMVLVRVVTEVLMNITLKEELTEIPVLIMEVTESQIIMKTVMQVQTITVMNLASLRMRKIRMIFLQNILKSLENINLFYSIFFNQGSLI
jgi:hypothetical protein